MAGKVKNGTYAHDFIDFSGLAATLIVVIVVARMVHRAVMEAASNISEKPAPTLAAGD